MYTIYVNNVNLTDRLLQGTLSISLGLYAERSVSASFFSSNDEFDNEIAFADGKDVKVYYYGDLIFGGVIKSSNTSTITPLGDNNAMIQTTIQSDGYNSIASRRFVQVYYPSATAGSIVTAMINSYLVTEGITAGTITTGPTLTQYTATYKSIKEILDDMATVAGFVWYIDNDKKLYFISQQTVTNAAVTLEEGGTFKDFHDVQVLSSNTNYANKVFVVGDGVTAERTNTAEVTLRQATEGGSGIYGTVIQDNNIKTTSVANAIGDAMLKKLANTPVQLSFSTHTYGFLPAQKLTVILPSFFGYTPTGLPTQYYLIENVTIDREDAATTKYTISATKRNNADFSTKKTDGFKEYFETLVK